MAWAYFKDVLEIRNGRNQRQVEDLNGQYPIYGSGGIMGYANQYLCEGDTVVIGRKGSINKPIFVEQPFWNVDTAFGLIAHKNFLFPKYLYYFCKAFNFEKLSTTVTIPSLTKTNLKEIKIPLPLLDEQKRIAAILDKAHSIRQKREQNLNNADALIKSVFLDMFGDPVTNPKDWEVKPIDERVEKSKHAMKAGPFGSSLKKQHYSTNGYKIYGQEQVIRDDAFYGDYYIPQEKYDELSSCRVKEGDVLISLVGTFGKVLIVPTDFEEGIINPRLIKLSLDKNKITPLFFKYFFTSDGFVNFLERQSHGQVMGVLNLGKIRNILIPTSPIDLQHKFAEIVTKIEEQKAKQKEHLHEAEQTFKALQQQFFG